MATVQTVVDGALRDIDQLKPGYTASANDYAVCLEALNQMLAAWAADGTALYQILTDPLTLTGAAVYAWNSSGAITTPPPKRLVTAYTVTTTGGVRREALVVDAAEFQRSEDFGATSAYVEKVYYDGYSFLNVWPIVSSGTLYLLSLKELTAFPSMASIVALPSGYEYALRRNLAVELAPEFKRDASATLLKSAADSKAALVFRNAQILNPNTPPAEVGTAEVPA